jgi:predicted MPP superfamily phosphohydrolase
MRNYVFTVAFLFFLVKLIGSLFLMIEDVTRLIRVLFTAVYNYWKPEFSDSLRIGRLKFFSYMAITFAFVPFVGLVYGIFRGAYKYRLHKVQIPSSNLPNEFDGFKIIQLSDMHVGSFVDATALEEAFEIVMKQNADLILFTGDLVNNTADETEGFLPVLQKLKAPYGVYSVLGNHDYGDYIEWNSAGAKADNFERLKRVHAEAGWRLLLNENLPVQKNGQEIGLLGVENWGGNLHFKKYGNMEKAYQGSEKYPFKILLSHDPSHWNKEVSMKYTDVDLTLSGHTHGMQFGIEIPGLKWSPVKYLYPQWAGLYKRENQSLYVNRGIGFIGYPGRLGIWPEITLIELKKA